MSESDDEKTAKKDTLSTPDAGRFTQGSVSKNIIRLAWPMILAQLVGVLYNIVDRMFIGHMPEVGADALTGLGVVFPLVTLWNAFANWAGQGGATLFAIERGRDEDDAAEYVQGNSFFLLFSTSIILTISAYIFEKPLLNAFGAGVDTYQYASDYMRIYVLGTAFQLISLGMNPFLAAQGFARKGMLTVVIGAVVNLILDPILIFGLNMGVKGAAIATVIAQFSSAVWIFSFLRGKNAMIRLRLSDMKPRLLYIKDILILGFANFVFQLTNSITQGVSNSVLKQYGGDLQVGVMTVIMSVRQIFSMPIMATNNAAKPFLSYNYGAGAGERVVEAIKLLLKNCLILTAAVSAVIMIFPQFFMRVFTPDKGIISAGITPIRIYFICFTFMSLQMVGQSTFTALGFPKEATFFSLLRKVFLILPLTIFLPKIPGLGVNGVYLAETLSQIIGGSACFSAMWAWVAKPLIAGRELHGR